MSRYVRPSGDGPEYTDVLKAQVERLTAELDAEKEISAALTFDREQLRAELETERCLSFREQVATLEAQVERLTAELAHMQTMQKVDQRVFEKLRETQDLAEHWAILAEQRRVELGECRKDGERLDWLLCRVSEKEYRRIGIEYSAGCLRSDIDAAMEAKP